MNNATVPGQITIQLGSLLEATIIIKSANTVFITLLIVLSASACLILAISVLESYYNRKQRHFHVNINSLHFREKFLSENQEDCKVNCDATKYRTQQQAADVTSC